MGIPLACALLLASVTPGASQEPIYETSDADAVAIYRGLNRRFPKLPSSIQAAFDNEASDRGEVEPAVASFASLLDELARAARARRCEWTYDPPPSITGEYPLDFVLTAARVLVVRSRIRFQKGDTRAAVEDMLVLSRFGSDLTQDRWLIGRLMGLICTVWSCDELREWIREGRLQREHLALAEQHLQILDRRFPAFKIWLRQEREMAVPLLEEIRDLGLSEVARRVAKDTNPRRDPDPLVARWEAWLQETLRSDMKQSKERIFKRWDELIVPFEEALSKPLNAGALTTTLDSLKKGTKALSDRMARHTLGAGAGNDQAFRDAAELIFILWIPSSDRLALNHANACMTLETTLLASRLEIHRLDKGSYPMTLRDLGKELSDPYDGGVLKYRRIVKTDGEGFVLTAAGPDADAEKRIDDLSGRCRFEKSPYETKWERAAPFTAWAFRRR